MTIGIESFDYAEALQQRFRSARQAFSNPRRGRLSAIHKNDGMVLAEYQSRSASGYACTKDQNICGE